MFSLFYLVILNLSFAEMTHSFDSYFYVQKNQAADAIINPSNQILKTPSSEYHLDLRGEIKWRAPDKQMILRPRLVGYQKNIELNNQTEVESKGQADLTDAFYEQFWTPQIFTTVGLQVYQWGPAEFINASNPLYHFNLRQKSAVYKEKGQALLRLNFSPNKDNSYVFIFQPVSNNEPEWIAEDTYNSKVLVKYEASWAKTSDYIGFVAGSEEKTNLFVGEYFNYNFFEGFSAYADLKHAQNRINFIPEVSGPVVNLIPEAQSGNPWPTLGVFGVRWEGNYDIRLEYIYNGMGFTRNDLNLAIASVANYTNPAYPQNLSRFLKPGLELLGQNYLYASYRVSEPFKFKELNIYLRFIKSLQDESSQMQFEFDKSLRDSFLLFSNVSYMNGSIDSEFRLLNDWQALIGIKWGL